jgi:hypothetical protein
MIRLKEVLSLLTQQPFRPFRIRTSDGSSHLVSHPEMVKASQNTVIVFSPIGKYGPLAFDDYDMISMLHITKLEVTENGAKTKKSGGS